MKRRKERPIRWASGGIGWQREKGNDRKSKREEGGSNREKNLAYGVASYGKLGGSTCEKCVGGRGE